MTDTAVDFFLENLVQLIYCDNPLILQIYEFKLIEKEQVRWFYEEMQFLRQFLKDSEEIRNEQEEVKHLVARIRDVTHQVEDIFDFFVFFAAFPKFSQAPAARTMSENLLLKVTEVVNFPLPWKQILATCEEKLKNTITEINSIRRELMKIYERKMYGIGEPQIRKPSHQSLSRATSPIIEEETVVGFDDDTRTMLELLLKECEKQLKVIPIIGMPGIGKTTLARKVYNDPLTQYHFHRRAWTYVSQVYHKRDLILSIFSSAQIQLPSKIDQLNDDQLGGELYKRLKGIRYLIVMDDLWNIEAWNDLKRYFPNDNNGSRVVFTSRNVSVAVTLHAEPYNLHFLNEEESWDLLQIKAFRKENCPTDLIEIGKKISKKCQGLPLALLCYQDFLQRKTRHKIGGGMLLKI